MICAVSVALAVHCIAAALSISWPGLIHRPGDGTRYGRWCLSVRTDGHPLLTVYVLAVSARMAPTTGVDINRRTR